MPSNDKRPTFRSALRQRMEQAKTAPAPPRSRLTRRFTDFLIIAGGILLAYPLMSASYPLLLHGRLEANYTHAASSFAPLASSLATVQREASTELRAKHLAQAYRKNLRPGQPIGRIKIPTLGIDYLVLEGNRTTTLDPTTDVWLLRKGPVHYAKTPFRARENRSRWPGTAPLMEPPSEGSRISTAATVSSSRRPTLASPTQLQKRRSYSPPRPAFCETAATDSSSQPVRHLTARISASSSGRNQPE